jgi:RNA exonuclease 1
MQMCHCRVLDTVALFPHPRGPPYKSSLRYLATKYLQRSIQEGEHDSAVDARAAMDLALLKIEKGVTPTVTIVSHIVCRCLRVLMTDSTPCHIPMQLLISSALTPRSSL